MPNQSISEMDMLKEVVELLTALRRVFHGANLEKHEIHYRGCTVEVSFKVLEKTNS